MSKSNYSKPELDVEKYTPIDVITTSINDANDLHSTDDYNYGGGN